jgi:hypothetical protein
MLALMSGGQSGLAISAVKRLRNCIMPFASMLMRMKRIQDLPDAAG